MISNRLALNGDKADVLAVEYRRNVGAVQGKHLPVDNPDISFKAR